MLAPQNQNFSVLDSMDGTLSEWFGDVDQALRASEVIPGNYEYTVNTSYEGQCPVQSGGSTKVDVTTDRFKCVSLDNSYIEITQTVPITLSNVQNAVFNGPRMYYIGYKCAFDAISQYRIYSNTDIIQTQNHPNYESFIMNYNALGDYAKETSDIFATYDKVQRKDPHVPGVYYNFSVVQDANSTINVTIPIRIPLNLFLMLKNLKWFPGWMGRLSLEFYPHHQNLVICPIFPEGHAPLITNAGGVEVAGSESWMNNFGFTQLGVSTRNLATFTAEVITATAPAYAQNGVGYTRTSGYYSAVAVQMLSCLTQSNTNECRIRLATYTLNMDVYNALAAKYLQVPLMFPIQQIQTVRFSNALRTAAISPTFTIAATGTFKHCDSMFIVFNSTVNDRTCFMNPEINFQVNIDGKFFPRDSYNTVDDVRFQNMILDAYNVNNNPLLSMPEDIANSTQPYSTSTSFNRAAGPPVVYTAVTNRLYSLKDRSCFAIGIPFSNDEDFMGGISTGGTVQFELVGQRLGNANIKGIDWSQTPTAIFLEDAILKIRSMKPNGSPQWDITNATIEQISAGFAK